MTHIMIDLETLDTKPTTVILSIGAVAFDPFSDDDGVMVLLDVDLDVQHQITHGRTISADTLKWWMEQDDGVIKLSGETRLYMALDFLTKHIKSGSKVWGNGSTFDISILDNAYSGAGETPPWNFWDVRDMRTIVDLVGKEKAGFNGTKHNAIDDAIHQAGVVSRAYKKLGVTK